VTLVDLNSRNGTFVNGIPVTTRQLEAGDRIQIGDSLLLFAIENDDADSSGRVRFAETVAVGPRTGLLWHEDQTPGGEGLTPSAWRRKPPKDMRNAPSIATK